MKNFYLTALCLLLCGGTALASPRLLAKKSTTRTHIVNRTPDTAIWRPAGQTDYLFYDGEWVNLGDVTYTYDERGNAIVTLTESIFGTDKTEAAYDDNNMVISSVETSSEDGTNWYNYAMTTYKYDTVLPDYYVERMGYDWEVNGWVANYRCETNDITRNEGGNITEIVKSLPLGENMTPAYKLTWTYDSGSSEANSMAYFYNYNEDGVQWDLEDDVDYRNIEWNRTNGQMTEADLSSYFEGENRISKAQAFYDGEPDGYLLVSYNDKGGYLAKETYNDSTQVAVTMEKRFTDDNGSYIIAVTSYMDEGDVYSRAGQPSYIEFMEVKYDSHGNIISEEYSEIDGGPKELLEGYTYEYKYDDNGNIEEVLASYYDLDLEAYLPESRIVYSNYVDVTGIENVGADTEAPAEYFDLMGRKVSNPAKGIYIKRQGHTTSKVYLR